MGLRVKWVAELWHFLVRSAKPSPPLADLHTQKQTGQNINHVAPINVKELAVAVIMSVSGLVSVIFLICQLYSFSAQVEYVAEPTPSNCAAQFITLSCLITVQKPLSL
ncbi:hypothetical protein VNO80_04348 [Phaseolus coccineus]|uniref:Uncharacterized protein n=1 Tax=Phaseolus coccineus TaxID=3886 RepID=A0AAN9NT93_PHACN